MTTHLFRNWILTEYSPYHKYNFTRGFPCLKWLHMLPTVSSPRVSLLKQTFSLPHARWGWWSVQYKQDHFSGVLSQKCPVRYICISQIVFHTFRTGFLTICSKCEDLVCTNIVQYHWYTFRQNRCGKVSSPTGGKKKKGSFQSLHVTYFSGCWEFKKWTS